MRRLALASWFVSALSAAWLGWLVPGHGVAAPPAFGQLAAVAAAKVGASAIIMARARTADGLASKTELRRVTVSPGAPDSRSTAFATLSHPADAVVRTELLRSGRNGQDVPSGTFSGVVAAVDERSGSPDYGSALWFISPSGETRRLVGGLAVGSRPLAGDDGLVYVQRGMVGLQPEVRGALRVDSLEIDAVDPATGKISVVMTWQGYITHLAGAVGSELLVYRVGPQGAELTLVNRSSGKTKVVARVAPFARDFSIDAKRNVVIFSNRSVTDEQVFTVDRVDLGSGARTELVAMRDDSSTPFVLADGTIFFTAPERRGLVQASSGSSSGSALTPLGVGYTYVTHASGDGAWLALAHVPVDRGFDVAALYERATRRVLSFASAHERIDIIGVVGGQSGSLR